MIEQQIIEELYHINNWLDLPEEREAIDKAICAIEELQKYRVLEQRLNGLSIEQVVNAFIAQVEDSRQLKDYQRQEDIERD